MRSGRAQGYAILTDPEKPALERDTYTCGHCNRVVFVPPRADPATLGGWCGGCARLICTACEAKKAQSLTCEPFEKWLAEQEQRTRFRQALG